MPDDIWARCVMGHYKAICLNLVNSNFLMTCATLMKLTDNSAR